MTSTFKLTASILLIILMASTAWAYPYESQYEAPIFESLYDAQNQYSSFYTESITCQKYKAYEYVGDKLLTVIEAFFCDDGEVWETRRYYND